MRWYATSKQLCTPNCLGTTGVDSLGAGRQCCCRYCRRAISSYHAQIIEYRATGINDDKGNNSVGGSGAVYLFWCRKASLNM